MTKVKVFSGGRSNGKTRRLMEYAAKNGMAVLTTNKNSLEYKASCYGIKVPIFDMNDVLDADCSKRMETNIVIDDCATFIEALLKGFKVCAVSITDDFVDEEG